MSRETSLIELENVKRVDPLDVAGAEERWVVTTHDGRSLMVSGKVRTILETMHPPATTMEVAARAGRRLGIPVTAEDIGQVVERLLLPHGLVRSAGSPAGEGRSRRPRRRGPLLLALPLFPPRVLRPVTRCLQWLLSPRLMAVAGVAAALVVAAFFLVLRGRTPDLSRLDTLDYCAVYALAVGSVLFHELGHAAACDRFNCPHGGVGFDLYLLFPVFWADVTESWRLPRGQRLVIDVAGMYFQALFIAALVIAYLFEPEPVFYLGVVGATACLMYNFHPVLKFDGYWVLCDLLGLPNLHQQAWRYLGALLRRRRVDLGLGTARLWVFRVYAVASAAFIAYFVWILAGVLPSAVVEAVRLVGEVCTGWSGLSLGLVLDLVSDKAVKLLFLGFILYRAVRMVWGLGRSALGAVGRWWRGKAQGTAMDQESVSSG